MKILLYIPILISFFICSNFIGCSDNEDISDISEKKVTQRIISFTSNHSEASYLKWSLDAKEAVFLENHEILIEEPSVKLYEAPESSDNIEESENVLPKFILITGDEGKVNNRTKDMVINGNVKGVSENGTLYTNELFWKDKEGLIYVPGEVKIVRGDSIMNGKNMTADPTLEIVNMDDVDFTLYAKDEKLD